MARHKGDTCATVWERLVRRSTISESGCWEWNGYRDTKGYGRLSGEDNKVRPAHRIAYEYFIGDTFGLHLDHLCANPACWNPWHLQPVDIHTNNQRAWERNRSEVCGKGHPFTDENTGRNAQGWRYCRQCSRDRVRAWKQARAAS